MPQHMTIKITSDVLEEVKQFFKDCDFADKPESIKDYSLWAVRYDGPGFYQGPTPRQCTYPRDHDNYIVSCFLSMCHCPYIWYIEANGCLPIPFYNQCCKEVPSLCRKVAP